MAELGKICVQSCIQRQTGFPWHGVVCTGVHFNAHAQYVANQHRSIRDKVRYKPTALLKVYLKVSKVQENRKSTFRVVSTWVMGDEFVLIFNGIFKLFSSKVYFPFNIIIFQINIFLPWYSPLHCYAQRVCQVGQPDLWNNGQYQFLNGHGGS